MDNAHNRNVCIIAHIDHGKSTLANRRLPLAAVLPFSGADRTCVYAVLRRGDE